MATKVAPKPAFDPVSAGLSILSFGLDIFGAVKSREAEKAKQEAQIQEGIDVLESNEFLAQVAENNAIIQRRNAADAITRGRIASGERELKTSQNIGRQRVLQAARGIEVDTGTAARVTEDLAANGKLDALRIVNNSERESAAFGLSADTFKSEASLARFRGANAVKSGFASAKGTATRSNANLVKNTVSIVNSASTVFKSFK